MVNDVVGLPFCFFKIDRPTGADFMRFIMLADVGAGFVVNLTTMPFS